MLKPGTYPGCDASRQTTNDRSDQQLSSWVAERNRSVEDVCVQICIPPVERNRILADESLQGRRIVSGAVIVEAGGIEFASGVGKTVGGRCAGYGRVAERLERVLSLESAGGIRQGPRGA